MKQLLLGVLVAIVLAVGMGSLSVSAAVNDFTVTRYDTDYQLGRDGDGRSTLKTVERITANFPQSDQNHGLERALPLRYADHSTSLKIISVVDEQGRKLPYSSTESNGNRVIRIGDADTYVHGLQTYVITYTQRDVTRSYADTGRDEFYWDINGTQWKVPIERMGVSITVDGSVVSALSEIACYRGAYGESGVCQLNREGSTLAVSTQKLSPYENITVSLGFAKDTFSPYQMGAMERIWEIAKVVWVVALIVLSPIAVILFIWAIKKWYRLHDRRHEVGSIVPEYLPPQDYSVAVSSQIEGVASKVFTAQLMDLAVRHYIKIYQTKGATKFKTAQYELELAKSIDDLQPAEKALMSALFPSRTPGDRFAMKKLQTDATIGAAVQAAFTQVGIVALGLRREDVVQSRWFKRLGGWMMIIGALLLSPVIFILGVIIFCLSFTLRPLTDEGLALRRYLLGLKRYISVAEVDRLRMLQSPEGTQKIGVDASSEVQLVKLYERVLPYAILFNQEKEWNRQLGAHYESAQQQPDWYQGVGVFNAAVFGAAMGSFSTSAASSYVSSTSSSSGSSSGGGFSGGGGGGGGGGGW